MHTSEQYDLHGASPDLQKLEATQWRYKCNSTSCLPLQSQLSLLCRWAWWAAGLAVWIHCHVVGRVFTARCNVLSHFLVRVWQHKLGHPLAFTPRSLSVSTVPTSAIRHHGLPQTACLLGTCCNSCQRLH
ncbi:hypothetical protein ABBQ38_006280 [Trebouxia sp. C0009 RCD-2024]